MPEEFPPPLDPEEDVPLPGGGTEYNPSVSGGVIVGGSALITTPGGGHGDPHIDGLNGSKFEFTGQAGKTFALLSTRTIQLNATFGGTKTHTHFEHIGIRLGDHLVEVKLQTDPQGFIQAFFNNKRITRPVQFHKGSAYLFRRSLHVVFDGFKIIVTRTAGHYSYQFPHLNVHLRLLNEKHHDAHGVIGQTITGTPKFSKAKQGEGAIDGVWQDYIVDHLFATNFTFSRFNH